MATFPKKTIGLAQLEKLLETYIHTYEDFSTTILQLENEGVLTMVQSKGRTSRTPSLAFHYRIDKSLLSTDFHKELQHYRQLLHPAINLDIYYSKDPSIWAQDLPFLQKIDHYLKRHGFPTEEVPAPERSYELVGDEKWIVEKAGKELLERVGLYEKLKIIPVSEPLMFAINPLKLLEKVQYHLIVENKTTYQGLLPTLTETVFSTLIYGSGKTVIKSIEQFPLQYPVQAEHVFYYFGDIDREGILIWHSLHKRQPAKPATGFYQACLQKPPACGKDYQKEHKEALSEFLTYFSNNVQLEIQALLKSGMYHPQETLKTKELQQIWREYDWTS